MNIEFLCLGIVGGALALLTLVYYLQEYKRRAALARTALTVDFSFTSSAAILNSAWSPRWSERVGRGHAHPKQQPA